MDTEFWDNLIQNVLTTWVIPEVERRRSAGTLVGPLELYAAQVVFESQHPPEVRLNEEVRGSIITHEGSDTPSDQEISVADFHKVAADVIGFTLQEDDRPNGAHITVIQNEDGWFVSFDLLYNAARLVEHIATAREFLDAAKECLTSGRLRAFCTALFAAVELLAKGRLMIHSDDRVLTAKKHSFVMSSYSLSAKHGQTDVRFAKLLKRLETLRNSARYPVGSFMLSDAEAHQMLGLAEEMFTDLFRHAPARAVAALREFRISLRSSDSGGGTA